MGIETEQRQEGGREKESWVSHMPGLVLYKVYEYPSALGSEKVRTITLKELYDPGNIAISNKGLYFSNEAKH